MIKKNNPKFITFEGCEGSGKSTQCKLLSEYLKRQGIDCILTREIGGTEIGEKVRDYLLHNEVLRNTEILMIMAARFEHVEKVIKPALSAGKWVICDRFIDSTLSYQGVSVPIEYILSIHKMIFGEFMPDITFFMDIDPIVSVLRAIKRGDQNKFEEMDRSFHQKVYNNFLSLTNLFSSRIKVINASADVKTIHQEIVDSL
jgi:dTMP kinase